jgi:O-methyltransferase involved in polyketide biosynthesis
MSKLSIHDLRDVSETLLLSLYFQALESRRADALLTDHKAKGFP